MKLSSNVPECFARIDKWELSARAKRVAKVIVWWSFGRERRSVYALQGQIARRALVHETDLADVLAELQTAGVLTVRGRRGGPRLYTFLPDAAMIAPPVEFDPRESLAGVDAEVAEMNAHGSDVEPAGRGAAQKLLALPLVEERLADDLARASLDRLPPAGEETEALVVTGAGGRGARGHYVAARAAIEASLRQAGWSEEEIEETRRVPVDQLAAGTASLHTARVGETPSRAPELATHQVGEAPTQGGELVKHQVELVSHQLAPNPDVKPGGFTQENRPKNRVGESPTRGAPLHARDARPRAPGESLRIGTDRTDRESYESKQIGLDGEGKGKSFRDANANALMATLEAIDIHGELRNPEPDPRGSGKTLGELSRWTWLSRLSKGFGDVISGPAGDIKHDLLAGKWNRAKSPLGAVYVRAKKAAADLGRVMKSITFLH